MTLFSASSSVGCVSTHRVLLKQQEVKGGAYNEEIWGNGGLHTHRDRDCPGHNCGACGYPYPYAYKIRRRCQDQEGGGGYKESRRGDWQVLRRYGKLAHLGCGFGYVGRRHQV